MNMAKISQNWLRLRKGLDLAIRSDRLVKINFDFDLDDGFHRDDLDAMEKGLNETLASIQELEEELLHG